MEEAALQDYRDKDVHSSRDFTAKLYNGEKLPDTEGVVVKQGPQQNPFADKPEEVVRGVNLKKDPMAEVTGDAPDKWDKVKDDIKGFLQRNSNSNVKLNVTGG